MSSSWRMAVVALGLALGSWAYGVRGQEPQPKDIFAAIDAGEVEARFVARNPHVARLVIRNQTDRPLRITIPELVGGVPALAQFNFPAAQQGQQGNNNPFGSGIGTGQNQSVGGGAQNNPPQFIWNVPPEGLREVPLATVCLEFGKPNPRSSVPYRLVRIDQVAPQPDVQHVLGKYVRDKTDVKVAQAAVWHLANEQSWTALQQVPGERHVYRGRLPYFSRQQLDEARNLVDAARESTARTPSPIDTAAIER